MPDQPALARNFFFLISNHIEYLLNEKVIINFHQCRFVCSLVQAMCRTASQMKDPTPSIEMHCICTAAICLLEAMGENREAKGKSIKEISEQEVSEKEEDYEEVLVKRVSHRIPFEEASVTSADGFPSKINDAARRGSKSETDPLTPLRIERDEKDVNREESRTFSAKEQEIMEEKGHMFTDSSKNSEWEGGEYAKIMKWVTSLHVDGLRTSRSSPLPLLSPQRARRHRCDVEQAGSWPFLLLQYFNCENLFGAWISRFEAGWKLHSPTEINTSWKVALELDKGKNAQILWQWFQPSMEFLCGQRRRYVPWVEGSGKRPPRDSHSRLSLPKHEEGESDYNVEEWAPSEDIIGHSEVEGSPTRGDLKGSAASRVGKRGHGGKEDEEMLTQEEIISFYGNPQLRQWRILYEDLDYLSHPVSSPLLSLTRENSTEVELQAGEKYFTTLPSVHGLHVRWEEDGDAFQDFRGVPFVPSASSSSTSISVLSVSSAIRKDVKGKAVGHVEAEYEREPHFLLESGLYWHHLPVQLQILEEKAEEEEDEGTTTVVMKIEEEDEMLASQSARSLAVRETSMFFVEEAVLRCKWQFSGLVRYFGAFTEKICSRGEEKEQRLKVAFRSPPKGLPPPTVSSTFSEDRPFDPFCTRPCTSGSGSAFPSSSEFIPVAIPQIEKESSASSAPRLCLGLLREDIETRRAGIFQGKHVDAAYVPLSSLLYTDVPLYFSAHEVVDIVLQAAEVVQYLEADRFNVSQEIWRSWMTLSPSCLYVRKCHFISSSLPFLLLPGSDEIISSSIALRHVEHSFPAFAPAADSVGDAHHLDPYALPTATRAYTSSSSTTKRPFTATPSQRRRNQERFFTLEGERREEEERSKQNGRNSFCWHVKYAPPCYVKNGVISRWRPHPKAQSVACYALFQLFLALLTHRKPYDAEWFHRSTTLDVSDVYGCLDETEKEEVSMEFCTTKEGVLPGMLISSTLSSAGKELYRRALCLDKTAAPMTIEAFKEGLLRWESENVF